jgi:hypothetical protein
LGQTRLAPDLPTKLGVSNFVMPGASSAAMAKEGEGRAPIRAVSAARNVSFSLVEEIYAAMTRSASVSETETSRLTPRSAIVTPNSRSMRDMVSA